MELLHPECQKRLFAFWTLDEIYEINDILDIPTRRASFGKMT